MDDLETQTQSKGQEDSSKDEKPTFEKKLEEMRAENERMERNIAELKELKAINALSGKSDGVGKEIIPVKETDKEYADRIKREIREGKFN